MMTASHELVIVDAPSRTPRRSAPNRPAINAPLLLRGRRASVAGGAGAIALAGISSDRRIRAPRALRSDSLGRIVAAIERRDDLIRRHVVFDPVRHGRNNVMRGIAAGRGWYHDVADRIRPETQAAMLHSRRHEQPIEGLDFLDPAHLGRDLLVIVDRALSGDPC